MPKDYCVLCLQFIAFCAFSLLCSVPSVYCVLCLQFIVLCAFSLLCSVPSVYCVLCLQFIVFCAFSLLCSVPSVYCALCLQFIVLCAFSLLCSVPSVYCVLCLQFIVFCAFSLLCSVPSVYCALCVQFIVFLWFHYASPSYGEAYRDRRLTTNFELWVEISPTLVIDTSMERSSRVLIHGNPKIRFFFKKVRNSKNQHSSRSRHAPICRPRGCILVPLRVDI